MENKEKRKLGFKMVKTVLKIDGMMCGMCESHMNNLIRNLFQVKKVTSSAKDGETVIISEQELDMSKLEKLQALATSCFRIPVNRMSRRGCSRSTNKEVFGILLYKYSEIW